MDNKIQSIIESFKTAEIEISQEQAEKFSTLFEYMVEYNENVNLTSITDFSDVVMKHFIDSVLPFMGQFGITAPSEGESFIDVGTGAGFPALPLLILRPDLKGTLCDSLQKRCDYLEKVCNLLGIKAKIIHSRSEELGQKRRDEFDFATARAVAAMPVLCEYCLPFVKVGGRFIALKSVNEDISAAENAVKTLGGELKSVADYKLPNGDDRRVVVIKKNKATPQKYPRAAAKIKKSPL